MTTNNPDSQHPNPGQGDATDAATSNAPGGSNADGAGDQGKGGNADIVGDQGKPKTGEGGDGTGDGQNKPDDAGAQDEGVPEAYDDFTLPEGFQLDGERKEATLALFRDLGLSQAKAQSAIDHFIKTVGDDQAMQAAAAEAAVQQQRDEWAKQAKTELGANYDSELKFATTAVEAMQSPALKEAFNAHGWGNHPELIKAFAFFGKMMRDSSVDGIGSSGAAGEKPKPWDVVYAGKM